MSKASRMRQEMRDAKKRGEWPTYRDITQKLVGVSQQRSEWAGIPTFMQDFPMQIEPRYPYHIHVDKIKEGQAPGYDCPSVEVVNTWFCERLMTNVSIVLKNGKLEAAIHTGHNRLNFLVMTVGACLAWLPEAEEKAHQKLREITTEHQFNCYKLTGTFLESSKRSKVVYLFRKLRPTVAMSSGHGRGEMKGLCTLCLHPIGYYRGTHCGAMVPTDDVIAHLVMMRGDEHYFWRCASQHPIYRHECGI